MILVLGINTIALSSVVNTNINMVGSVSYVISVNIMIVIRVGILHY